MNRRNFLGLGLGVAAATLVPSSLSAIDFRATKPKAFSAKKVDEAIKALFEQKGSKEYYRVYRNGFGSMESFYLVSVSAKDEIDSANRGKANEDVLGPDRWETFSKVMNNITRMEEYSGSMRPDLSYSPKKE